MKISIVIPVYNEAQQLGACLEAIAKQTVKSFEVLVIDNNSSDGTFELAQSFSFVKLLSESKQGVVHARTLGFDEATGDVIGRIDADTILSEDWVESVVAVFEDSDIDAVSGVANYLGLAYAPIFNSVDLYFRRMLSRRLKDRIYLWGANMAIRKEAWNKARPYLCNKGYIHEDYDLAIHLQEHGGKVTFDERMKANVSSRRVDMGYLNFMKYVLTSTKTYADHNIARRFYIYWVVLACAVGYFPARVLHRGYNPSSESFSASRFFNNKSRISRIDPTSNVD